MRHRLLTYLTVLSTLALPMVAVMWGRSYVYNDTVYRVTPARGLILDSIRGEVSLWVSGGVSSGERRGRESFSADEGITAWQLLRRQRTFDEIWFAGFGFARTIVLPGGVGRTTGPVSCYVVPYWFLTLACGLLPVTLVLRHVHAADLRRATAAGNCGRCGYDLEAAHVRGPECGEPVAVAAADDQGDENGTGSRRRGAARSVTRAAGSAEVLDV